MVGDIDGDCIPDVVGLSRADDEIQVIDGATGLLKFSIPTYSTGAGTNGQIAIADVDRNGWGDIFILSGASNSPADRNKLIRYEFDGTGLTERFKSTFEIGPYNNYDVVSGSRYDMLSINLADINFDGIPEAVVGNQVFNAIDGAILAIGGPDNSIGSQLAWVSNQSLGRVGSFPVLADVLPDFYCNDCSGLELVAGNMIYSIGLRGGPNTSTMTVEVDMSNEFPDGMTSIADFDKDGHLDVLTTYGVASTAHRYGFAIWNPLTSTIFDQREFTNNGAIGPGRTSIANLDNQMDDLEFVIRSHPNLIVYKFDPLTTTVSELNRTTVNDPSRTSTTIFDLDQDGQNEIFYRDEDQFRILKGDDLQDLCFSYYTM